MIIVKCVLVNKHIYLDTRSKFLINKKCHTPITKHSLADKIISLEDSEDRINAVINEFKDKTHKNIAENDIEFFEKVYLELAGN